MCKLCTNKVESIEYKVENFIGKRVVYYKAPFEGEAENIGRVYTVKNQGYNVYDIVLEAERFGASDGFYRFETLKVLGYNPLHFAVEYGNTGKSESMYYFKEA
jgi:hypothetical protein